jgi:hypothetical protein
MIKMIFATAVSLLVADAALAGPGLNLAPFSAINAHGGAGVVLRHGSVQRVTVVKGDLSKADLHLTGKTLDISPCKNWCWNTSDFKVEIVSPRIDAIEAHGGGAVKAEGDFPKQPMLSVEAHGGGAVDVRAIPADTVRARAHGGGAIKVKALSSIDAEANGGGAITYSGNPAHVMSQTHAGGAISRD